MTRPSNLFGIQPIVQLVSLGGSGGSIGGNDPGSGTVPPSGQIPTATGSNSWAWGSNVAIITSNSSNQLLGPFVNFQSGTNVLFAAASNTLTISATGSGGAGGAAVPFSGAMVTKASQSVNNATLTKLLFDAETYDTDAYHSTGANTERLTIPSTDRYRIGFTTHFGFSVANELVALIQKNGTTGVANALWGDTRVTTTAKYVAFMFDADLTAGDYLEVEVYHDNGSARAFTKNQFTVQRLTGGSAPESPLDIYYGPFDPRAFTQTSAMTAADYAFLMAFQVYRTVTVNTATTYISVSSGNISVGIYDNTGARLATTGGIACPAAGERTVTFTSGALLTPGNRYYMAMSTDNTTMAMAVRHGIVTMTGYMGPAHYPLPATLGAALPGTPANENWLWVLKP